MTYVIIGNGIASLGAIDGIRKYDRINPITVIGLENTAAYGKPLTSYLLAGRINPGRMSMRTDDYYKSKDVSLKLATHITQVDLEERVLLTSDGDKIPYAKLLIATGGKPYVPEIKGVDGDGVYNFTDAKDAYSLIESVKGLKRAVVIGGGLIGLKAAESLYNRGVEVAVVEGGERILSLAYDAVAAGLISKRVKNAGMLVRCGVNGEQIVRDKSGKIA